MKQIQVALWGFGAMGSGIAKVLLTTKGEMVAGVMPKRTSEKANFVSRSAITMSAAAMMPLAPPIQAPCTSTMTALSQKYIV